MRTYNGFSSIDEEKKNFLADCPGYEFIPTTLPAVKRIIVLGDIHGDLELAIKSFLLAKLIEIDNTGLKSSYKWVAKPCNTVVIQVGDQVDSCRPIPGKKDCHKTKTRDDKNEDMKVIDFFNLMHELAKKAVDSNGKPCPGAVYSLLGNHELMNVDGDFRYVSHENNHNFEYNINGKKYKGETGRKEAFKPGGQVSEMLGCKRNSVMIIGSNMFIHAGVLPALVDRIGDVDFDSRTKLTYLNSIVRKWLLGKMGDFDSVDLENKKLFIDNTELISPFWTRIYGQIKPETISKGNFECENVVGKALKVFKIGKIVVGHTPQLYIHGVGINGTCYENNGNGDLWRVDGGFSKAFGSTNNLVQVLEILDDTEFNVLTQPYIKDSIMEKIQISKEEKSIKKSRRNSDVPETSLSKIKSAKSLSDYDSNFDDFSLFTSELKKTDSSSISQKSRRSRSKK